MTFYKQYNFAPNGALNGILIYISTYRAIGKRFSEAKKMLRQEQMPIAIGR
ncbi:MAG: hypothetical protein QM800_12340 [Paludibacter sp.]